MDNQNLTPTKNSPKVLTRRNIFTVLGIIIGTELIWAGWMMFHPTPPTNTSPASRVAQTAPANPNQISLNAPKNSLKVGEDITVSLVEQTTQKTDGTDLIIIYDPKMLSVELGSSGSPVIPGTIYKDYPQNKLDKTLGRVAVSGVTDVSGGVVANGLFGSVVFKALAPGQAKISFDFTPGKTGDSNMAESGTGKDILEKVNNLELNIVP